MPLGDKLLVLFMELLTLGGAPKSRLRDDIMKHKVQFFNFTDFVVSDGRNIRFLN